MEALRLRAFRIYLQHTLASALTVESIVNQRKQHHGEQTVKAVALWVRYCRSAQTVSGVLGILAIDGAESMLQCLLRSNCSFGRKEKINNKSLGLKFEKSAICYCKALVRQLSGDASSAALWSYAGTVYDQADAARLFSNQRCDVHSGDLGKWKARANGYGLLSSDSDAVNHDAEVSMLRAEIALQYHTKIAHTEVVIALCAHYKGMTDSYIAATGRHHSADKSAEYLIQALKYTENALGSGKPGEEELHALWKLCARYMRAAAADAGTTRDNSFEWGCACDSIAYLALKLAPAVRMINDVPTTKTVFLEFTETRRRLSAVFQQIDECPLVRDPISVAARHFCTKPISSTIEAIVFALRRVASGSEQEYSYMQRFLAAADRVKVDQSPAHPHIKQCWLDAAEQMRLAVAATTMTEYRQRLQCSAEQEDFAVGPLATVAEYFVKADLAVSAQAKDLWHEAAQLLITCLLPVVQRCLLRDPSFALELNVSEEETPGLRRVHELAKAAVCCEQADADLTNPEPEAFQKLRKAALQLRLAVLEWDAAVPFHNARCWRQCMPLLDWCAQRPRSAVCMISPPWALPVSTGRQQEAQRSAETRINTASWLCESMARVVRVYAAASVSDPLAARSDRIVQSLETLIGRIVDEAVTLGDPPYFTHLDAALDALEESQRQAGQSRRETTTQHVQRAAWDSAEQFRRSAEYSAIGASRKYIEHCSSGTDAYLEMGERARQAGRWYAAAAQAAAEEQWDVWNAFELAATFMAERDTDPCETTETRSANKRANTPELRPTAVKAGERFARAAEVLLAGDRELYEMWLKAAEATAYHIDKNPTGSLGHLRLEGDPEVLARAAQERQNAVNVGQPHGDVRTKGQDGKQNREQRSRICAVM
jgi:hypothetical protein